MADLSNYTSDIRIFFDPIIRKYDMLVRDGRDGRSVSITGKDCYITLFQDRYDERISTSFSWPNHLKTVSFITIVREIEKKMGTKKIIPEEYLKEIEKNPDPTFQNLFAIAIVTELYCQDLLNGDFSAY